jgi:hypothetical protein
MKFTVEVEDFYLEEEEMTSELKKFIQTDLVMQIYAKIKTQVIEIADKYYKEVIERVMKNYSTSFLK